MCKAIKDGGTRCAYHVGESASAALVTYVASTTGLGGPASREAFSDLVAEYADAPAPERAEVDEFLEQQIFRANHEPALTEKRRASIVRRLRDAIGKALPSGATFAAWKNLVGEAWTRVRRKAAVAFVAGALTFSLGACGTTGESAPEPVATQSSAVVTTAPAEAATAATPLSTGKWKVKNVHVSDGLVAAKGDAAAKEVESFMTDLAKDYGFNEQSIKYDGKEGKAESKKWMLAVRAKMTPRAAADWTKAVNTYFNEKDVMSDAWRNMMSLTSYGMIKSEHRISNPTEPTMFDMTIKKMNMDVIDDGRVHVSMDSSAKFNFLNEGRPAVSHLTRTQEFWLTHVDGAWKIDGWTGTMNSEVM